MHMKRGRGRGGGGVRGGVVGGRVQPPSCSALSTHVSCSLAKLAAASSLQLQRWESLICSSSSWNNKRKKSFWLNTWVERENTTGALNMLCFHWHWWPPVFWYTYIRTCWSASELFTSCFVGFLKIVRTKQRQHCFNDRRLNGGLIFKLHSLLTSQLSLLLQAPIKIHNSIQAKKADARRSDWCFDLL